MRIELSWNLKIRRNTNTARLLRRHGLALRLTGCFGAIFAATIAVGLEDSGNLVWVANGLLLSYLLLAPRWLWKHYFAAGFAAILLGGLAVNPDRLAKMHHAQRPEHCRSCDGRIPAAQTLNGIASFH